MGALERKIEILGEASKFDVCASMASPRNVSRNNRIGNTDKMGICHAFAPDGRCISLFKVLMTNECIYDCAYCVNNSVKAKTKVMFKPTELARAFMGLYIRNYVEGLFLSSGVCRNTTYTTEKMIEALNLIRKKYLFHGYLHIKVLPGTDKEYIKRIMELADRVSLNIELPSSSRLSEVSSMKDYHNDIIRCQKQISQFIRRGLVPAGQTTQFIVGTTGETDREIIERLYWEYKYLNLKRGYFSHFTPIKGTPLGNREISANPRRREHFLYRIDWLLRKYNYQVGDIYTILDDSEMIPLNIDPKMSLAARDDLFPLDVNEASYNELLRVPGIGEISARRIINLRRVKREIHYIGDLKKLGVIVKRAKPFLIVKGRRYSRITEFL
ncbi:MAG: putative DNA modification/repair radical SAM protein [Candidatus Heimdallarchaeota archaeon]